MGIQYSITSVIDSTLKQTKVTTLGYLYLRTVLCLLV